MNRIRLHTNSLCGRVPNRIITLSHLVVNPQNLWQNKLRLNVDLSVGATISGGDGFILSA